MSDPRVEKTKMKVLSAARQLLVAHGFSGVTIEALTDKSGVAKTTIYRHWEHAAAVMVQAYSDLILQTNEADTGSLQGDLQIILNTWAFKMHDTNWTVAVTGMIEASAHDEQMRQLHGKFMQQIHQPIAEALQRAQARGEIRAGVAEKEFIDSLVGPIMYAGLLAKAPINPALIPAMIIRSIQDIQTTHGNEAS